MHNIYKWLSLIIFFLFQCRVLNHVTWKLVAEHNHTHTVDSPSVVSGRGDILSFEPYSSLPLLWDLHHQYSSYFKKNLKSEIFTTMFLWHLYATSLHFELACMASMILQGVFLQQQCLNWKRQAGRSVVSSQIENFPMHCPLHENFLATSHMKYCQLPRWILNRRAKWT